MRGYSSGDAGWYPQKYPQKQIDVLAFGGIPPDAGDGCETGQVAEKRHEKTASGDPETVWLFGCWLRGQDLNL